MTAGPLVTAIVAVFNEEMHLGQCLDSLLAQSWKPLEIIVADDGSTDRTADIARQRPGVRLVTGPHVGKARTVNGAAAVARGEVLLFLDGDLYFEPDYVARMVEPIVSGASIGTCHGTERVANPDNPWSRCWQMNAGLPVEDRVRLSPAQIAAGSTIFRALLRDRFLAVGGFDDTGHTDDHTLYPKLGRTADFVPDAVCYHYNVETLGEVFRHGVWGGKSEYHRKGARALLYFLPPRSLAHAFRSGVRRRSLTAAVYTLVTELGVSWGLLVRALRFDRTYAA